MSNSPDPTPLDRLVPLKPEVFHLLLALAEETDYGYNLIRRVREASDGRIRMLTGTLYRRLEWMLDEGLVKEGGRQARAPDEDARRQYYRITERGRRLAAREVRRLDDLLSGTIARKLLEGVEA